MTEPRPVPETWAKTPGLVLLFDRERHLSLVVQRDGYRLLASAPRHPADPECYDLLESALSRANLSPELQREAASFRLLTTWRPRPEQDAA